MPVCASARILPPAPRCLLRFLRPDLAASSAEACSASARARAAASAAARSTCGTRARRRFDRRLLRRRFQADDFGRESAGLPRLGPRRAPTPIASPTRFSPHRAGGQTHVGVRLGASPGGVDRPARGVSVSELSCTSSCCCRPARSASIALRSCSFGIIGLSGPESPPVKSGQAAQVQWLQQVDDRPWFPYNGALGGDLDSTEIRFRRMRAEDHHPR